MAGLPVPVLAVVAVFTTLVSLSLVRYAVGRLDRAGARAFAGIAGLMTPLSFVVLAAEQSGITQWDLIPTALFYPYVGLWVWFAIDYTGERSKVSRAQLAALMVPLVVGVVTVGRRIVVEVPTESTTLWARVGVVTDVYGFALLLGGVVVLARVGFAYTSTKAGRTLALVTGGLLPVVVPVVVDPVAFPSGPMPSSYLFGYAASAVAFAVAAFRYDLFESVPVAEAIGRDTVVTEMEDGVVVTDADGRVVDVNPAAEALLGIAGESVLNAPAETLFDGRDTIPEDGWTTEITVDDGTTILSLTATSLLGAGEQLVGRILTLRDVTGQVRRRRQLETLNRQNERLDQLISVVSHDLRNPLTTAAGYLDLMAETEDFQHVETVRESLDRMDTIVEELLTMARSGVAVEETETVDLSLVVGDAWATVRSEGATLANEVPDSVTVEADRNLLQHVLENLFRNANEHNDPPVTVRVGVLGNDAEGFYVEDDGDGIPPDERETVFEHGYTSQEDGTGFGLSIVEQFVSAHGWEISVTSGENGGARFEVRTDGNPEGIDGDPEELEDALRTPEAS